MACSKKKKKSSPQRIEGVEPGDCEDGADNDGDGLFDCADDSCAGSPICEDQDMEGVTDDNNGPSNNGPTPTCDNGTVDANGECVCDDGFIDGGDGTCVAEGTCSEGFIDGSFVVMWALGGRLIENARAGLRSGHRRLRSGLQHRR